MKIKVLLVSRISHHDIFWQNQIRCAVDVNDSIFHSVDNSNENPIFHSISAYELSQEMNLPFLTEKQIKYVYQNMADSNIYMKDRFDYIMCNLFIFETDNGIEYKTVKQNIQSLYDLFFEMQEIEQCKILENIFNKRYAEQNS